MVNIKEFRGNELAQASAVKEDLTCSSSSPLNKSDQVISLRAHDGERERAPGPGLKLQAPSTKHQASSTKLQAPSESSHKLQAPSPVAKASSFKPQASSAKIPDPGKSFTAPEPRCSTKINVLRGCLI